MISLIGYLASVFLGISLLVNNDLKFRWLNTFGCFTFVVYGAMIGAFPVILTNVALFIINVFYLVKIHRTEEAFDILEYQPGDKIISKFLQFYGKEICQYFPNYKPNFNSDNVLRFVVLRDMVIANIFEATLNENGNATVHLNYTVEKYRDYKVGKFIFDKEKKYLTGRGVRNIFYEKVDNQNHENFLRKMGFEKNDNGSFVKMLA